MAPRSSSSYTIDEVQKRLQNGGNRIQLLLARGKLSHPITASDTSLDPISQIGQSVDVLERGISLGLLIALTETFNLQNYYTHQVVQEFIKPVTLLQIDSQNINIETQDRDEVRKDPMKPYRFAELGCFREYFGKADTFVSHCWNGKWGDLVAAVSSNGSTNYPLTRTVWIDIFAVTQHPQMDALQDDLDSLQHVIANVPQGTTLVWNPRIQIDALSNPALRAWCLFEVHTTLLEDNALLLKLGSSRRDSNGSDGEWLEFTLESDVDVITKLVFETDIRNAKATMPQDIERIHKMIQESQGGFDEMNTRIRTAIYNNWRILQIPSVQAALSGSKELVISHLEKYDRETYEGDPGGSMLHDLVHGNLCNAAEMAIECGAPIDHQTDKGNTPLMFAAEGGRIRMCRLLVEKGGAALDLQNKKKETALHLASKYGRIDVVKYLLEKGANEVLEDSGNYTPAGLARLDKMPGCKEVLNVLEPSNTSSGSYYNLWCCFK